MIQRLQLALNSVSKLRRVITKLCKIIMMPSYADLAKTTKPVKEVWLEQVAKQTPGIDSYFVTNNLTSRPLSPSKKL